jgi:hypothetical protein
MDDVLEVVNVAVAENELDSVAEVVNEKETESEVDGEDDADMDAVREDDRETVEVSEPDAVSDRDHVVLDDRVKLCVSTDIAQVQSIPTKIMRSTAPYLLTKALTILLDTSIVPGGILFSSKAVGLVLQKRVQTECAEKKLLATDVRVPRVCVVCVCVCVCACVTQLEKHNEEAYLLDVQRIRYFPYNTSQISLFSGGRCFRYIFYKPSNEGAQWEVGGNQCSILLRDVDFCDSRAHCFSI